MNSFDVFEHRLTPSTVILEASAGTGKTFSLTALVIRLLVEGIEGGTHPRLDGILLVTFTNKATDELRCRLRRRLSLACKLWSAGSPDLHLKGELEADGFLLPYFAKRQQYRTRDLERLRAAEAVIDQAPISTIHSFCARVLAEFASRIGLPPDVAIADDETERRALAIREAWRSLISRESNAQIVESLLDSEACKGSPPLKFDDLEYTYQSWVSADRPFLPVEGEATAVRDRWHKATWSERRSIAEKAWEKARISEDVSSQRTAARRFLFLCIDERLDVGCLRDGVLSMDALVQHLSRALRDADLGPELRQDLSARFPAVLIDEFQDTDPVQASIFTQAFSGGFLRCVGDPKQSIYRFRGADLAAYCNCVAGCRVEVMDTNFRSAPGCVAVVNHLFREERQAFLHPNVHFAPSRANRKAEHLLDGESRHVVWWWTQADKRPEAEHLIREAVVAELCRLMTAKILRGGIQTPFRPKDAAVLTSSNRQAAEIAAALRNAGISAVNRSQEHVASSAASRELAVIVAALARPLDGALARTALCTKLWGGTEELLRGPEKNLHRDLAALRQLAKSWRYLGVLGVLGRIMNRQKTRARILATQGGERYVTDLYHIAELAHGAGDRPAAILAWLERQGDSGGPGEAARLRLEDDGDAVAVMTVHAAKGLEWPVVFAPFLWCSPGTKEFRITSKGELGDARPLRFRDATGWIWDYRKSAQTQDAVVAEKDQRAETVRQCYVALTRAGERTYTAWGPMGKFGKYIARSGLAVLAGLPGSDPIFPYTETGEWLWPKDAESPSAQDFRMLLGTAQAPGKQLVCDPPTEGVLPEPPAPVPLTSARGETLPKGAWSIRSFTSLIKGAEFRDVLGALGDESQGAEDVCCASGLQSFPAGAGPGDCLHRILEGADWNSPDCPANRRLIHSVLTGLALSPDHHQVVFDMLGHLASSRIPGTQTSLGAIPAAKMRHEWAFDLCLESGRTVQDLASAFRSQADDLLPASWADRVAGLKTQDLSGFLSGRADLIACIDGRWWVIDWKSNRLHSYSQESLHQDALEHFYPLQWMIYLIALHRHLSVRIPGYTPELHLGGVAYCYLRGLPDQAWLVHRPSVGMLSAVDAALGRGNGKDLS